MEAFYVTEYVPMVKGNVLLCFALLSVMLARRLEIDAAQQRAFAFHSFSTFAADRE